MKLALLTALSLWATAAVAYSANDDAQVRELRQAAEAKTKEIGRLAESGKLPTNDEALKLLQRLVQELADIRERLRRLEANPPASATAASNRVRWSGYTQYQYQSSDRKGDSQFDAFRFRRVRLALDSDLEPRLALRVSFDLATGTNQTQEQLRDAWAVYDFSGGAKLGRDRVWLGQMAVSLGYELERSSADREMPERAQYNQILFPTERSRGVRVRREGTDGIVQAGIFNALTINDPEQANLPSGAGNKLVGFAGARWNHERGSVGVSGLAGDRPAYSSGGKTSPEVPRRFAYLDAELRQFLAPRLTLRGELMAGRDRLPSATADPSKEDREMAGYHLVGVYQLSNLDRLAVRWEHFDPDVDSDGNALHGLGAVYQRELTKHARLSVGHEIFVDQARASQGQTRYGVTTLRLQVRF